MTTTPIDEETASDELKRDLSALRKDLQELKADLRGLFTDAKAVGRHRLEEVQGGVSETVQAARRFEQETVEALREQIEDHPWGSLAAAFCAGIFAGSFFSKRG